MVFHVGCDADSGNVCVYDTSVQTCTYFTVDRFFRYNVEQKIRTIISNINGNLGCLCVYVDETKQKVRRNIIHFGNLYGFEKVGLIDYISAKLISTCVQTNYKSKDGDIIWLSCSYSKFFKWKRENDNFIVLFKYYDKIKPGYESYDILKPDIIVHTSLDDVSNEKEKFPNCIFLKYKYSEIVDIAAIKARIMAKDAEYIAWDVINVLPWNIIVKINDKQIMSFEKHEALPTQQTIQFEKVSSQDKSLIVINDYTVIKEYSLPNMSNFVITVTIDINAIILVNYNDANCTDLIQTSPQPKNDPLKKLVLEDKKVDNDDGEYGHSLLGYDHEHPSENKSENGKNDFLLLKKITTYTENDVIGIDLGTSRCCAAVNRKNGIETVALDNKGERLLPSFIAYDEENIKCGQVVIDRLRNYHKSTIFDLKRIIGRAFNDKDYFHLNFFFEIDQFWPFKIPNNNGFIQMGVTSPKGEIYVSAEEVATSLLKYVKEKSEGFQGKLLTKAVITIPANFTENQKASTFKAAKLAGFDEVKLLPEPISASFAYFVDRTIPNHSTVLLFDLGGGTLDVCLFKIINDKIHIICNGGDSKLGGRDFDTVLINYFKNLLLTNHGISFIKNKKFKLMLECQKIKENLTTAATSCLDIEEFDANQEGLIYISRVEFEQMTTQLLNKIKNTINSTLYTSDCKATQIDKVLQVGGGSRMPMIKQLLKDLFPTAEHCCEEHPDEVVAIGAAYYAYSIFSSQ